MKLGIFSTPIKNWYASGEFFIWKNNNVFFKRIGTGPEMLLIHGFPTAGCDWLEVANTLSKHYTLIVPDLLDYGQSENFKKKRHSIHDQVDMLQALLSYLDISSIHMLAHDVGDTVAQEILARDNESSLTFVLNSCVLLNGGLLPAEHRARSVQKWLLGPFGFLVARFMSKSEFMAVVASIFGAETRPSKKEQDELWNISVGVNGRASFSRRIHYMSDRIQHETRWVNALKESGQNILLINGSADPVSGRHAADAIAKLMPNIKIQHLKKIGHFPPLEAPDDVTRLVLEHHGVG